MTPAWLVAASLGLACAGVACTNVSGSRGGGYAGGSGGGPLGSPGAGSADNGAGDDASAVSQSPGPTGGASGDDASSAVPEASTPTPGGDAGGAADAGTDGGIGSGADGGTGSPFTFTLLDTSVTTNVDGTPVSGYDPLANGTTFSLGTVGTALSIRANTVPATVGSVQFSLDGTYTHVENATPYTLCGDNGAGTVTPCPELGAGTHTLTATEYTQVGATGTTEGIATIQFTITQ